MGRKNDAHVNVSFSAVLSLVSAAMLMFHSALKLSPHLLEPAAELVLIDII